jgi:hypothetical protein
VMGSEDEIFSPDDIEDDEDARRFYVISIWIFKFLYV